LNLCPRQGAGEGCVRSIILKMFPNEIPTTTQRRRNVDKEINKLVQVCHTAARNGGWWMDRDNPLTVASKLCLVHSEISEAMEGHRKGLKDAHLPNRPSIEVELADAVIRIADLAGALELDLGGAIVEKLQYNANRSDHKLEVRAADGGKKY